MQRCSNTWKGIWGEGREGMRLLRCVRVMSRSGKSFVVGGKTRRCWWWAKKRHQRRGDIFNVSYAQTEGQGQPRRERNMWCKDTCVGDRKLKKRKKRKFYKLYQYLLNGYKDTIIYGYLL